MVDMTESFLQGANISNPRERPRNFFSILNSPVTEYERTFAQVLQGKKLVDLIKNRSVPVVIDLLSPPGTVYELLLPFSEGRGLAVSLPDHDIQKEFEHTYGADNVKWLHEDVTRSKTWVDIKKWLKGDKADLIMERGKGGLGSLPENSMFYQDLLNKAWGNLSTESGILLFELPPKTFLLHKGIPIDDWVKKLQEKNIDVKYDDGGYTANTGKIMITRTLQSPTTLPLN